MKPIEINIDSSVFEELRENINDAMLKCLEEVHQGNFNGGEISIKINIDFDKEQEVLPNHKIMHYKKPNIEHKTSLTLKRNLSVKGGYNEKLALKKDGKRFILERVHEAQLSLEDLED